jgi:hypothetical protein
MGKLWQTNENDFSTRKSLMLSWMQISEDTVARHIVDARKGKRHFWQQIINRLLCEENAIRTEKYIAALERNR